MKNPLEQPPKDMPVEQIPLDLEENEKPTPEVIPEVTKIAFESLPDSELYALYKERVGVDPSARRFDRTAVLAGLADPKAERDRLSALDLAEDQELRRMGRQHF